MAEVIEFEQKKTVKDRFEDFKAQAKVKIGIACDWCKEHKEFVKVVAPAVIGGIFGVAKVAINAKDRREARELEEAKLHSVYDRSAGMYLTVNREPTNEDYLRIQSLKREGKTTGEALYELGLLEI